MPLTKWLTTTRNDSSLKDIVSSPSTTTYGLLGMLATRSWTGYELTQQLRRSLRFVWPSSEGHLYREQKKLVALGWATVEQEPAGQRTRKRYTITNAGREALCDWHGSSPEAPRFEIEGVLRLFYGDQALPSDLAASLNTTADGAESMRRELLGFVADYLEPGGPLWMLENEVGGPDQERLVFKNRTQFPERLHVVAMAIEMTTALLSVISRLAAEYEKEIGQWPTTTSPDLTDKTRRRLEDLYRRFEAQEGRR